MKINLQYQSYQIFLFSWAQPTADVCDIIQIPAYLCRQTSILEAAAKTMRPINIKKRAIYESWNMKNSIRKIEFFEIKKFYSQKEVLLWGITCLLMI